MLGGSGPRARRHLAANLDLGYGPSPAVQATFFALLLVVLAGALRWRSNAAKVMLVHYIFSRHFCFKKKVSSYRFSTDSKSTRYF